MLRSRGSACTSVVILALLLFVGCNSSPTVPVPPPEAIVVYPPDSDGFALVEGRLDEAETEDMVLVINRDLGSGTVTVVEPDGSFAAEVQAEVGDTISVQVIRGDTVSDQDVQKTVPSS